MKQSKQKVEGKPVKECLHLGMLSYMCAPTNAQPQNMILPPAS